MNIGFAASRTNRRALIGGAAAAVVGGVAVAAGIAQLTGEEGTPSVAGQSAGTPTPEATQTPSVQTGRGTPTVTSAPVVRASQTVAELPPGTALVSSPRLPLFSVGSREVADLLAGNLPSWVEAGAPIDVPVEPLALASTVVPGSNPIEQFADYESLAAALASRPGAVAVVPLDQLDFRANVLAIDGVDPLRDIPDEANPILRIGVVGDIVPGRNVDRKMRAYGDFTHPFHRIAAELRSYDVTFANLEGNLSANIAPPEDTHTFSFISSPEMLEGFKLAGIDAVSLANNHSRWNSAGWGESAFLDTMDALRNGDVPYFGAGRDLSEARTPWVAERNGRRIAIIGIDGVTANEAARADGATVNNSALGESEYSGATDGSSGTNPYILDQVLGDIGAAAGQYDIVIPYFHFGVEYVGIPPQWAVDGARAAIDAGATMVVTNHPHVIQGMETYGGKPIVYSVGNFIFDQMFSVEVRTGLILELVFRGNKVVGLRTRGVEIEDFCQPRLMTPGEHAAIMDRFWTSSDRIAARG